MPKSKEFIYSDDNSSDEEVKSKKRKRENGDKEEKTSKKESEKNEDNVWDLGNNRQITVRDYKGKFFVDIREMYFDKELNLKPGRKGICLSIPQWRKLLSVVDDVDKALKSKC